MYVGTRKRNNSYLLVGESVKGPGEGVQTSGVGEVRVGEGGSNEVGGVGGGISSLVVGVDAQVKAHELVEALVVVSKHSAEVSGVVEATMGEEKAARREATG